MPVYKPLKVPVEVDPLAPSRLGMFRWVERAFFADFQFGEGGPVLRVSFTQAAVAKISDHVSIVDIEPGGHKGIAADKFAYSVANSFFLNDHQKALLGEDKYAAHYRFIAGSQCLDVISSTPPLIRVLPAVVDGGKA